MQKKIVEYIKKQHMFVSGDRVLAAVSGGADSVCLLTLLCRVRQELRLDTIHVLHVHHGLRGQEADRDAAFVEELCRRLSVPFTVLHRDVCGYAAAHGCSVEEAGRILRYEALQDVFGKEQLTKIAVAHHQDDAAETILHHLVRGSGLKGLSGIPAVRGEIVRPLLCVDRTEIEDYLQDNGISFCTDSTNLTADFTRNKIRLKWIPLAQEINEHAVHNICQAGDFIQQADLYLEAQAAGLFQQYGQSGADTQAVYAEFPRDILAHQPDILQTYLIRRMIGLCAVSMRDITSGHIWQVQGLLAKQSGRQIDLPGGVIAGREYEKIRVSRRHNEKNSVNLLPTLHFRTFSAYNAGEIPKNQYTKWFDYDKIKGMLSVRTRQPGDYFTIGAGRTKRLKAYLADAKIPRQQRTALPLLAEENHIIWIIGYRISEYYKITKDTRTILEVIVNEGEVLERSSHIPEFMPQ